MHRYTDPHQHMASAHQRAEGDFPSSAAQGGEQHDPVLAHYLEEMGRLPLLSAEEEHTLARLVAFHNDQEARRRLVEANLRLVVHVAKRFQGLGLPLADLIQEGNLGLLRAVEKYDPAKGTRFSTYAVFWIRQKLYRAIVAQSRMIRLPDYLYAQLRQMERACSLTAEQQSEPPTCAELAARTRISEERITLLQQTAQHTLSLDAPISSHEDITLGDTIADEGTPAPEDVALSAAQQHTRSAQLTRLLGILTERERAAVILRFGLDDEGTERSLAEIGRHLHICRERARQLLESALQKLRERAAGMTEQLLAG